MVASWAGAFSTPYTARDLMADTSQEIKRLWSIIKTDEDSVLELRAIWPTGVNPSQPPKTAHYKVVDYGDLNECKTAFEQEALKLNCLGYNIYVVMNPIKANFSGWAAKDEDIARRDVLLIDIDRAQGAKEPATDAEVLAAEKLGDVVKDYLGGKGWPKPIRVMSGNGHHLYYALTSVANDADSKIGVQQLLKSLAKAFDTDTVRIDTSVFNAARITKVVGTVARKGLESEGRPYRMARVI